MVARDVNHLSQIEVSQSKDAATLDEAMDRNLLTACHSHGFHKYSRVVHAGKLDAKLPARAELPMRAGKLAVVLIRQLQPAADRSELPRRSVDGAFRDLLRHSCRNMVHRIDPSRPHSELDAKGFLLP